MTACDPGYSFEAVLAEHRLVPPARSQVKTVQINVGKLCNQACHHCHVGAGPTRTEVMTGNTAERLVEMLAASPQVKRVDLTGGAPELNPGFSYLVESARALGRRVTVRCNLTVLHEPGVDWLPDFYTDNGVELVCSLPCYTQENVDGQRGKGVFDKSIEALRLLNAMGYGRAGSALNLDLVYNPLGASLPPQQADLETSYREELGQRFGIEFNRLLTITNMPIKRFADMLARSGAYGGYMGLLVNHFNPETVAGLMCRDMVSVGWDGSLYDCDFNQMLELPLANGKKRPTIATISTFDELGGGRISTGPHCFGCTAGAGSSCGGALAS